MYTVLEDTGPKPLENPYHQVTLLGEGFPYKEWHDINDLYISSILSDIYTNCKQVHSCILPWVHMYIDC